MEGDHEDIETLLQVVDEVAALLHLGVSPMMESLVGDVAKR
jgi:hypothetical protein